MKYMGSKARIAKYILPIILKDRKSNQYYVEPFVGGFNMIDKVSGNRIGSDINYYLIALFKALQNGWLPPKNISEDEYNEIRVNKNKFKPELVGYCGFQLSYGGKFFGGYRRDKIGIRNYSNEAYNNTIKQIPYIMDIQLYNLNYKDVPLPINSIIYCDPPYINSTGYSEKFNHNEFYDWLREIGKHNTVFVSEYEMPDDFECIWSKVVNNSLTKDTGSKQGVEKLFIYNKNNEQ